VDLYPSIEEKAAHLLYFVTKNHSFSDGNKRIAAWLFLWYLDMNSFLYRADGAKRIADNALVALTLMIAESRPEEKETVVRVIVNLINDQNELGATPVGTVISSAPAQVWKSMPRLFKGFIHPTSHCLP